MEYIIIGTITIEIIKSYLKIIKNDKDRSFPRNSKTPFTKWNIKGYSVNSQLVKILELDKILKLIAKLIANNIKTFVIFCIFYLMTFKNKLYNGFKIFTIFTYFYPSYFLMTYK